MEEGLMEESLDDAIPTKDERTLGMLCHLTGLSYLIGIPGFIVPLVLWLVKKDSSDYIDYHGRESLNFQISIFIYGIVSAILILVLIGIFMLIALAIFSFIMMIIAAIKANDGVRYRYPLTIRIL